MNKKLMVLAFSGLLMQVAQAEEMNASSRYLLQQIEQGGPASIRAAARTIERSGERDIRVLDALAEAMLQNYRIVNNTNTDAMAWACKALAASGNRRYYSAVKEVAEFDNRKLQKYCERAAENLGGAEGEQYTQGMVSLNTTKGTQQPVASAPVTTPQSRGPGDETKFAPITEIRPGMSMEQVYAVAGYPTSTASYETGKRWIPFNYKGGDIVRTAALYKGQGRIVFSNNNAYSSGMTVYEVIIDPSEPGYP